MRPLLLIAVLFSFHAFAEEPQVTALIKRGDAAEKQGQTKAALSDFRAAEALDPKNVGILLRIAKQYSDLVDVTKSKEVAEQLARKSLDYSERALEVDPKVAKAHLSRAVAYGKLTDFVGNKTKLEYSKIIKEETAKSIELDPTDDFAWYVLGRWHHGVANVGGMPAATNEDAAKCLKKAVELAPQRIMHRAALARVYKAMNKADLATKEWQAILQTPSTDAEDEKEKTAARQALDLPSATPRPEPDRSGALSRAASTPAPATLRADPPRRAE